MNATIAKFGYTQTLFASIHWVCCFVRRRSRRSLVYPRGPATAYGDFPKPPSRSKRDLESGATARTVITDKINY